MKGTGKELERKILERGEMGLGCGAPTAWRLRVVVVEEEVECGGAQWADKLTSFDSHAPHSLY